jgi:hypothetical protein
LARRARVGPRRKPGRKYNPLSKRNQKDRAGRRGDRDLGQPALRLRKRLLTGGRGRLTREDEADLQRLRDGLDLIAGRRSAA